ncbi:hypothetical protein [Enterococcus sp. AZ109]|uniref:hypothetical protein n=1 Tax=Enterococcus sp. AZ109 TaxID=2774634 RepID=UPI003F200924
MARKRYKQKAKYAAVSVQIDSEFFAKGSGTMKEARKALVEAMATEWATGTKQVTSDDQHIDTAAYVNSIGYPTHFLGPRGADIGPIIHEWEETATKTTLRTGSGVHYAIFLEARYNIYARGLENSMNKMISEGLRAMNSVLKRK